MDFTPYIPWCTTHNETPFLPKPTTLHQFQLFSGRILFHCAPTAPIGDRKTAARQFKFNYKLLFFFILVQPKAHRLSRGPEPHRWKDERTVIRYGGMWLAAKLHNQTIRLPHPALQKHATLLMTMFVLIFHGTKPALQGGLRLLFAVDWIFPRG